MPTISALDVVDIRFPTSRTLDGSDAMNPDPDYSAAYVVLRTDRHGGSRATASPSPIGRGNELVRRRDRRRSRPLVIGRTRRAARGRPRRLLARLDRRQPAALARSREGRHAPGDRRRSSTRSGTCRQASGKPLWRLLADMTPEEIVALVDFRYITDALTPDEALAMLAARAGRAARRAELARRRAIPPTRPRPAGSATTTTRSAGCAARRVADGWTQFKLKVGARPRRRHPAAAAIVREEIGPDRIADGRRQPGLGRRRRRSTG